MSNPVVPIRTTTDLNGFFTTVFPAPVIASRAPINASDTQYSIGQLWINDVGNTAFILTSLTGSPQVANWLNL